jgi:general secretion pathway protein I
VRGARAAAGFTLVEVLVALAIVTIGMAAVMGALSSSANMLVYLRDKSFAQWVALNQIANVRLAGQQPATGNSQGDTDFAGRKWHWRQSVVTTQVPGVERIDVSVRPTDAPGDDEHGWFTTVSGIWGDSVGTPNGFQPDWGAQLPHVLRGNGGTQGGGAVSPGPTPPGQTPPGQPPIQNRGGQ